MPMPSAAMAACTTLHGIMKVLNVRLRKAFQMATVWCQNRFIIFIHSYDRYEHVSERCNPSHVLWPTYLGNKEATKNAKMSYSEEGLCIQSNMSTSIVLLKYISGNAGWLKILPFPWWRSECLDSLEFGVSTMRMISNSAPGHNARHLRRELWMSHSRRSHLHFMTSDVYHSVVIVQIVAGFIWDNDLIAINIQLVVLMSRL